MYRIHWNNFKIQHKEMYIKRRKDPRVIKNSRSKLRVVICCRVQTTTMKIGLADDSQKLSPLFFSFTKESKMETSGYKSAERTSHQEIAMTFRSRREPCVLEDPFAEFFHDKKYEFYMSTFFLKKRKCQDSRVLDVPLYHQTSCRFFSRVDASSLREALRSYTDVRIRDWEVRCTDP